MIRVQKSPLIIIINNMETQEHVYSQKLHPHQSASSKRPFAMIVMTEDSNIMVLVIEDSNMIIDLIEDSKIMTEDSNIMTEDSNIMILMIKDSNISICTVCATVFQICTRYVVIHPHHIFCPQCHLVLPHI